MNIYKLAYYCLSSLAHYGKFYFSKRLPICFHSLKFVLRIHSYYIFIILFFLITMFHFHNIIWASIVCYLHHLSRLLQTLLTIYYPYLLLEFHRIQIFFMLFGHKPRMYMLGTCLTTHLCLQRQLLISIAIPLFSML